MIEVYCHFCLSLTELPKWKSVTKVICNPCPELKELPKWKNIFHLSTSITKIPYYPKLIYYRYNKITEKYHLKYIIDQHIK